KRRSLAGEPMLERRTDPAVQSPEFVSVEVGGRPEWVESCAPQRLVDVDVPQPRQRPLVEERRLERRAPVGKTLAEPRGREEGVERLVTDSGGDVRVRLPGLEQEPRSEAPYVAIGDVRAVV